MKTIVAVSDSHGNRTALDKLGTVFAECDLIIHLGDTSADGNYIRKSFPDKTHVINGNCDMQKLGEDEEVIEVEGVKIFACHGDKYGVKYGYSRLAEKAALKGCGVALFGHTHSPTEESIGGVLAFNPGTLSRYGRNTYLYLVINGEKAVGKIVELQL